MRGKLDKFDKKDMEILRELRENCNLSVKKLALKLRMHPNTALQRIKRLEKLKIIKGYRADIDFTRLGYGFHAIVMLRSPEPETVKGSKTDELILKIPEVESLYRMTGENDWMIVVRALNRKHFMEVLEKIQETGKKTISYVILDTVKYPFEFDPL